MNNLKQETSRKLLTIVIPTKNRYTVLFPTLTNILASFPGRYDFEVVIQDNSEDNISALKYFEEMNDERVLYNYKKEAISIVDNTEIALSFGTGRYVLFIGDDDLVSPGILEFLENISYDNVDAIIYPPAYYWWNNVHFTKQTKFYQPGAFWFPKQYNRAPKWINTQLELSRVLSQGAVSMFDLPRLYHGIVKREVLNNIKYKSGKLLHGASPDMALAITLGTFLNYHLKVDFPLTVYGASRISGGGWTAAKKHYGVLEKQKHLPSSTIKDWSNMIPRIWSESTIYTQTAYEVLKSLKSDLKLNFTAFYASILINEFHLFSHVYPLTYKYLKENPLEFFEFMRYLLKRSIGKIRRELNTKLERLPYSLKLFDTVENCSKYLSKIYPKNI